RAPWPTCLPQGGRKHPQQEYLQVDTTNILFICGGAFVGLEKIVQARRGASGAIGLRAHSCRDARTASRPSCSAELQPEDLLRYGHDPGARRPAAGRRPSCTSWTRSSWSASSRSPRTPCSGSTRSSSISSR
ncbi:MAG: AAA family ATPase, partial [Candidatus Moduliflexus flocculans]|nr:AAA family ATPase [Candidatus Moduliflexus flocculans]